MIQILLITALVLLGVCLFLWVSFSFGLGEGQERRTPKQPKQKIRTKKERTPKTKKNKKKKVHSPHKRMEETIQQHDERDLGFKFDLDDDLDLSDLGIDNEPTHISNQTQDNLDSLFGGKSNVPIEQPKKAKSKSLEEEFGELFKDDETSNFTSGESNDLDVFGKPETNDFYSKPKQTSDNNDLSFLDKYDFSGSTEEKIDESIFKNKATSKQSDFSDLDDIKLPKIKGFNYEEEERTVEPTKSKKSNNIDPLDEDDLLKRLQELKNRI